MVTKWPIYLRIENAAEADVIEKILELTAGRVSYLESADRVFGSGEDAMIVRVLDRFVRIRSGIEADDRRRTIRRTITVEDVDL